jgi:hypothetical protein
MNWLSLGGVGAMGMVFAIRKDGRKRSAKILKHGLWLSGLGVLIVWVLFTVGCGGSSSSHHTQPSTVTVMVTGKSGSISHSTPITLTIQ